MPMDHATPQPRREYRPARAVVSPLVIFRVGTQLYGLPTGLAVRECMPVPELLPLVMEMPHISGCFRLGAAMVAALDMGVLLGTRAQAVRAPTDLLYRPLLLCNLPGGGSVGLVVDAALDVVRPDGGAHTVINGGLRATQGAGRELELADGNMAFMLRMTDIVNDEEQMRLDSLMLRARKRAALWAGSENADLPGGGPAVIGKNAP